jgi:hypothetical protein
MRIVTRRRFGRKPLAEINRLLGITAAKIAALINQAGSKPGQPF